MKTSPKYKLASVLMLCMSFIGCDLEDLPVYRTVLKIHTASHRYAATDDRVYVKLNSSGKKYYLDYGRNDFERNNAHSYDLVIPGISELGDIQKIQISKEGSNGLCIERVELYINNNQKMFDHNFGNSNCKWLDNSAGHSRTLQFSYSQLRNGGNWAVSLDSLEYPSEFSADMMESMVESIVGDQLKHTDFSEIRSGLDIKWGYKKGRKYVAIERKNSSTQKTDLDLALIYNYKFLGFNRVAKFSLDIDMDFHYQCVGGSLSMNVQNVTANASLEEGTLLTRFLWLFVPKDSVKEMATSAINDTGMINDMSQSFGECPTSFEVDSRGNLILDWPPFDIMDYL